MNPTNFSGLFGGGGFSKHEGSAASGDGGDAEMVTPLGQRCVE